VAVGGFSHASTSELWHRVGPGPFLESAVHGFQPLKGVEQLQTRITHLVRARGEMLGVLNGESDPIYCDPRLIGHLELDGGRPRIHLVLDRLKNLMYGF
jgi:hypothetical protein